jgi:hypothetical protein
MLPAIDWSTFPTKKKNSSVERIREEARLYHKIEYFLNEVKQAKTLNDLFILHIQIWANNIRNMNLGPDMYGMFRTDDILRMKKSEVFLGNINGLWTLPITKWEEAGEETCIVEQYRNHLISNLKAIQNDLKTV